MTTGATSVVDIAMSAQLLQGSKHALNLSKTELPWFARPHSFNYFLKATIAASSVVIPLKLVKILGVMFDEKMSVTTHVSSICRACHYKLRQLKHIHRCLDFDTASTFIHSWVTSRIDYSDVQSTCCCTVL